MSTAQAATPLVDELRLYQEVLDQASRAHWQLAPEVREAVDRQPSDSELMRLVPTLAGYSKDLVDRFRRTTADVLWIVEGAAALSLLPAARARLHLVVGDAAQQ
jgi:hypothetical protein